MRSAEEIRDEMVRRINVMRERNSPTTVAFYQGVIDFIDSPSPCEHMIYTHLRNCGLTYKTNRPISELMYFCCECGAKMEEKC